MLAIAGQTTEPNWLKYFEEIKFQNYNFFYSTGNAGHFS